MFLAGAVITAIGIFGTIWSMFTDVDFSDVVEALYTGEIPMKIRMLRFFNSYGIIIIVIGVILMLVASRRNR